MLNVKLGLRRYAFSLRHYNLPLFFCNHLQRYTLPLSFCIRMR